jgi:type IV secretory pathway VirB2 component (pilin)
MQLLLSNIDFRDKNFNIRLLYTFAFIFFILVGFDALASGGSNDPIGKQLCNIVTVLSGSTAKAVAMCALMSVGIGLFMGKVNWGVALTTAVGVIVIFGAGQIVSFLGGSGASVTC